MGITALVMAGGGGERLGLSEEKPLIEIHGKSMIQYVIEALKKAKHVSRTIVATTKQTEKTAEKVRELSVEVIETPGWDYISDTHYVIKKLELRGPILIVSADLPCITNRLIDEVIEHFKGSGKPALCAVISSEIYKEMGLEPKFVFRIEGKSVTPIGINIMEGKEIDAPQIKEEIFILSQDKIKFVINVNTVKELGVAMKILANLLSQNV